MPRKKKTEIVETFVPSKYQSAIFDFVEHGVGNAVVEAVAGSGKSTTALKCIELIGRGSKILLTAFNKDIVSELNKKVKVFENKSNVFCKTMHSLGYGILMTNFHGEINPQPNNFKYASYICNNIDTLSEGYYYKLQKKDRAQYIENIKKLVDFGRFYVCESADDFDFIIDHYKVLIYNNEVEISLKVMEWGKNNIDTIDFTDMVWLPNVLNCKPYGELYDWIICDECQDIMKAERMLILRCTKMSTRMLFFGEKVQCIYTFMGSDYRSFDELLKLPNTISLPLSISYRCSKNVVNYVKCFNPNIEAREDAPEGIIEFDVSIDRINDGDMVLCRNNAPLVELYCDLVKNGKSAYIRGKDAGSDLIKLIKSTKSDKIEKNLSQKGVIPYLYNSLIDTIDTIMKKNKVTFEMAVEDISVSEMYDKIKAIEAISYDTEKTDDLVEKINKLFSDKKKKGIELSTIHKAKGLESDNVFICKDSLMPLRNATEEWEIQQERNLQYVAYTRAKNNLFMLHEERGVNTSSSNVMCQELDAIKNKVFKLYGDENRCILEDCKMKEIMSDIKNSRKNNDDDKIRGKKVDIGKIAKNSNVNEFNVTARKKKKKK